MHLKKHKKVKQKKKQPTPSTNNNHPCWLLWNPLTCACPSAMAATRRLIELKCDWPGSRPPGPLITAGSTWLMLSTHTSLSSLVHLRWESHLPVHFNELGVYEKTPKKQRLKVIFTQSFVVYECWMATADCVMGGLGAGSWSMSRHTVLIYKSVFTIWEYVGQTYFKCIMNWKTHTKSNVNDKSSDTALRPKAVAIYKEARGATIEISREYTFWEHPLHLAPLQSRQYTSSLQTNDK